MRHQPATSSPPQPEVVKLTVRLTPGQHAILRAQAEAAGVSLNALLRLIVYDYTYRRPANGDQPA